MADERLMIQSSVDITSREKYKELVDPATNAFKRIVNHYWIRIPIKCAIKSCRQPHNDGFLVELANGDETNIGHVCGRRYFGESFSVGVDNYRRDILIPELRQKLVGSKDQVRSMLQRVLEMCAEEEAGLGRQKRNFRRLFPQLTRMLNQRAARSQAVVSRQRQRTSQEIDDLVAINPGTPRSRFAFEEIQVGQIQGLQTIGESLHDLLHKQLREPIERFLNENVSSMSYDRLIEADLLLRNLDELLSRAGSAISDARNFFSEDNVELLKLLDLPDDERRIFNITHLRSLALDDPRDLLRGAEKKLNRRQRRKMMIGPKKGAR